MNNDRLWTLAPIGIAKVSSEGRFLAVNPCYCSITGYAESEMLLRTFQQITHPDDLESDAEEAKNLASNPENGSYHMVKRYIRKDGRTAWVSLHVFAETNATGQFANFLVFAIELLHVGVYPGSIQSTPAKQGPGFIDLFKKHPKESILLIIVIVVILQGGNVLDLIRLFLAK